MTLPDAVYQHQRNKYRYALKIAGAEGVHFRSQRPPSTIVYAVMRVLGYRWVAQTQEWLNWRQSYIEIKGA